MLGNLVIRNKKVDMSNLKMNTMGGTLVVNGYYESSNPKKPTTAMNLKMENFDIQETFKTLGVGIYRVRILKLYYVMRINAILK